MLHSHSHSPPAGYSTAFGIGIGLNIGFVIIEAFFGLISNSLALIADAGHNLGDVLALALAWGAFYLAKRKPTSTKTYGLRRTTILAAFISALLLLMTMAIVAWEALWRFTDPTPVSSKTIIIVAAVGVVINTITALLFLSHQKSDLNIKAAFIHMSADAAISLGVVVIGIIIMLTNVYWVDPAISLFIVVAVVLSTWGLLRDSFNLAIDGVPKNIELDAVKGFILEQDNVKEIHDLHIWAMSTTQVALTAHIVRGGHQLDDNFLHTLAKNLESKFGIVHSTMQIESGTETQICAQSHDNCM